MTNKLSDEQLWDRYETELRELYDRKVLEKPIYPLFHLIRKFYDTNNTIRPVKGRVVEVGFGNGGLLRSLAEMFTNCYGLDISSKNIDLTSAKFQKDGIENVEFLKYNILEKPPFDGDIDALVLSHILEHFDDIELKVVLSNARSMLKPGGLFFGATPYLKPLNNRICPDCGVVFEIDGHKQVFDEKRMLGLLKDNGFSVSIIRHFNPEHFYLGTSYIYRICHMAFNKLFDQGLVTQLEFVAIRE
jgi:SAM-dependent methyltransferase